MKRFLILTLAALTLAGVVYAFDYAGTFVRTSYQSVTADDTDIAFLVRYKGSSTSATVTVGSNGDLTFLDAGSAVTEFECPVSGALGGIIDVSDTACNTLGEVVDIINASTNWRAVILDGLRTDDMDISGTGMLLAQSTIDAKALSGFPAYIDTDTALFHSRSMGACRRFDCLAPAGNVPNNPWQNTYTVLNNFNIKSTYGSGTSTINIYAVLASKNAETATLIWTEAGGSTGAYNATGAADWPNGLIGPPHQRIVVRTVNSAAMATAVAQYGAMHFNLP